MHLHCRIATVNENSHYRLQWVFPFLEKCGSFILSTHPLWESGFHMKTLNEFSTQTGCSAKCTSFSFNSMHKQEAGERGLE